MARQPLDRELYRKIQVEVDARDLGYLASKVEAIRARCFQKQLDFLDDPFRYKALLCPRRAGKTYAASAHLIERCLRQKDAMCAFVTMTRPQAKRNLWNPLKRLNTELDIGIRFNNTELLATFPNGSMLQLTGSETDADSDKLRGIGYDLIVIDECKSFPSRILTDLVTDIIPPALNDRLGTLIMMGTPGSILDGPFYDVTCPTSPAAMEMRQEGRSWKSRSYDQRHEEEWKNVPFEWSLHRWQVLDNVAMPHLWEACQNDKKRQGWADDNPIWLREYMGQWLPNDGRLVYRYNEERNGYTPLKGTPYGLSEEHEWKFVLGVDLGYDDDFALQVAAYSDTCEEFFQVYEYSAPRLILPEIAAKIREAEAVFKEFEVMVGDRGGLGKTIFKTLEEQYDIHIEMAEKNEKRDYIEILNSELADGKCKIMRHSKLSDQMRFLQWDKTHREEIGENHDCDAFLYLWRWSLHHFSKRPKRKAALGTVEHGVEWDEEQVRQAEEAYQAKMKQDYWDKERGDLNLDGEGSINESWDGLDS